jgi:ubiquinone/menaquinone biosynthesis C-methylase UbiE
MRLISTSLENSGARRIGDRLRELSGGRVLDVATGDGDFIRTLEQALMDYDSFTGVDVSEEQIEMAREKETKGASFIAMNAEGLEFPDNSFDTVCIASSLHHLEDVERVLSEMRRVLRPGGSLIVQEMFSDGDQTEAQLSDILSHNLDADIDQALGVTHRRTFTRGEILGLIEGSGFKNLEVFESSRYVKCLFCEDRTRCDDPLDEGIAGFAIKEIEGNLERVRGHPDYSRFRSEADEIMSRIKRTGSSAASILFIMGEK